MGAKSKILTLPPELRAQLERMLTDQTHGGYEALAAWLADAGYTIGKSSIHRYDQRLQAVMSRIRASTEAARLIAQASPDDADEHSAAVLRMVQSALFDAMTHITDAQDADPAEQVKLLSQAARAISDASRASITQKRWADEVRGRLDALEKEAGKGGRTLDAETLQAVRAALYGG